MYLEGSDQHRGWFQSSLLESCGTRGRAPFDVVLTHGFTLDESGRKMSKSLGNQTFPQDVIRASGADILRLWVASVDYTDDQRIGPEILKAVSDNYRKLRNTIRWMLGTLAHREPGDAVGHAAMPALERLMLHKLAELDLKVREAYEDFDFARVVALLAAFMNIDLSAFYFDIRKDALYCDAPSSVRRRGALEAIEHIFRAVRFGSRRCWSSPPRKRGRRAATPAPLDPSRTVSRHSRRMARRRARPDLGDDPPLRLVVTGAIEIARAEESDRLVARSRAARLPQRSRASEGARRRRFRRSLHHLGYCDRVRDAGPRDAFRLPEAPDVGVVVERAGGVKCARSWRYFDPATAAPDFPDVTPRDAEALRELKARAACRDAAGGGRRHRARRRHDRPIAKAGVLAYFAASDVEPSGADAVPRSHPAVEPRHFVQPVRPQFGVGRRRFCSR